jgi:hypothetical protein
VELLEGSDDPTLSRQHEPLPGALEHRISEAAQPGSVSFPTHLANLPS